jgi:hypothetical protein
MRYSLCNERAIVNSGQNVEGVDTLQRGHSDKVAAVSQTIRIDGNSHSARSGLCMNIIIDGDLQWIYALQ